MDAIVTGAWQKSDRSGNGGNCVEVAKATKRAA